MKSRYRIIVYDLEKKEVKADEEISEILAACVVEGMYKAAKNVAWKIRWKIIKKAIKERFGGNANESN